jgi:hypothetical protein
MPNDSTRIIQGGALISAHVTTTYAGGRCQKLCALFEVDECRDATHRLALTRVDHKED